MKRETNFFFRELKQALLAYTGDGEILHLMLVERGLFEGAGLESS